MIISHQPKHGGLFQNILQRYGKVSAGTLADLAGYPHPASQAFDHFLYQSQPQAGALKVIRGMHSLEHAKEILGKFHIKAHTVVPDIKDRGIIRITAARRNDAGILPPGKFYRVRKNIGNNLFDQKTVAQYIWDRTFEHQLQVISLAAAYSQLVEDGPDQLLKIHRFLYGLYLRISGIVQKLIDQRKGIIADTAYIFNKLYAVLVHRSSVILQENSCISVDGTDRSLYLMGDTGV